MAATTFAEFDGTTEGLHVAEMFSPGINGKTIMVTGVNLGGIGFATSRAFASQSPAHLIITGRNTHKIQECVNALKAEFPGVNCRGLQVDLSIQHSVRDAAAEVMSWTDVPVIDIVVNSAGVMGIQERTLTSDGIETHFATNHLGHWLLTCLIMSKLIAASAQSPRGATRVVNVSSASPCVSGMRWSDIKFDKRNKDLPKVEQPLYEWFHAWGYTNLENESYNPLDGYNRSKVANVLFGIEANQRLFEKHGILGLAVHPGVIDTELGRNFSAETLESISELKQKGVFSVKSMAAGASTSMVAALDPKLAEGVGLRKGDLENWGSYLMDCQISNQASPLAVSSQEARKLWELSESLVGQAFSW